METGRPVAVSIAYLDTHVAVFLCDGLVEELSSAAKREIENNDLLISPMVVLEFEYLHARKKISVDARALTETLAETFGVAVCSFPFSAIVHESLSLECITDPFDRLIVGHATGESEFTIDHARPSHPPSLFQCRLVGGRFGSGIAQPLAMPRPQSEENDVPFAAIDNRGRPGTMDKPVDAIDAPGKADSELGEDQGLLPQRGDSR